MSYLNGFIIGYDVAFIISELWYFEMNFSIFSIFSIKFLYGLLFRLYIIIVIFNFYYKTFFKLVIFLIKYLF